MNEKFKIDPNSTIRYQNIDYKFKDLVELLLKSFNPINHDVYRGIVKKVKRKYFRQQNAIRIDNLKHDFPRIESRPIDYKLENEEERIKQDKEHLLWLEREQLAQIEWKAKKDREERLMLKVKQKEQRLEEIINSKKVSTIKILIYMKQKVIESIQEIRPIQNTLEKSKSELNEYEFIRLEKCKYFIKTGVCKYGHMCSKSHIIDLWANFKTLIFPGMYSHMLLGYELLKSDKDSDEALEYEESDILEHFKNFYDDVLSELKACGKVVQFLVCSNFQTHLRGNVYVQFETEYEAKKAFDTFNGRFYAGKKVWCFLSHVKNWNKAVCSKFLKNKCEKNRNCDYMHVFPDPYNQFKIENLSGQLKSFKSSNTSSIKFSNKWSSDDETDTSCKENVNLRSNFRSKEKKHERRKSSSRSKKKRSRSRSRKSNRKHKKKSKK